MVQRGAYSGSGETGISTLRAGVQIASPLSAESVSSMAVWITWNYFLFKTHEVSALVAFTSWLGKWGQCNVFHLWPILEDHQIKAFHKHPVPQYSTLKYNNGGDAICHQLNTFPNHMSDYSFQRFIRSALKPQSIWPNSVRHSMLLETDIESILYKTCGGNCSITRECINNYPHDWLFQSLVTTMKRPTQS